MSSKSIRKRLIKKYGQKCVFCPETENLTVDHIIRKRDGGTGSIKNLQFLCRDCHDIKDGMYNKKERLFELSPV